MNWIDTPLLVYSLVDGHPARRRVSETLGHGEWGSSVLVLLQVYRVLTRDYRTAPEGALAAVQWLAAAPLFLARVDALAANDMVREQARSGIEAAGAALLLLCARDGGTLFTLDRRLARVAQERGLATARMLDAALMDRTQDWEEQTLPRRGLPRVLAAVEEWLRFQDAPVADRFLEATSGLTALPTG